MSIRTKKAADAAAEFSLRDFVSATQAATPVESAKRASSLQNADPVLRNQMTAAPYDVGMAMPNLSLRSSATGASGTVAMPQTGGLTFSLPSMPGSRSAQESESFGRKDSAPPVPVSNRSGRVLRPGYLSGGGVRDEAEVLRLTAIVDDLQSRLRRSQQKISETEASVVRANHALNTEKTTSHARIHAALTEINTLRESEQRLKQQLAAIPSRAAADEKKFRIQAEGAMKMDEMYNQKVAEVEDLKRSVQEKEAELTASSMQANQKVAEVEDLKKIVQEKEAELTASSMQATPLVEDNDAKLRSLERTLFTLTSEHAELLRQNDELKAQLKTTQDLLSTAVARRELLERDESDVAKAEFADQMARSEARISALSAASEKMAIRASLAEKQAEAQQMAMVEAEDARICAVADLDACKQELTKTALSLRTAEDAFQALVPKEFEFNTTEVSTSSPEIQKAKQSEETMAQVRKYEILHSAAQTERQVATAEGASQEDQLRAAKAACTAMRFAKQMETGMAHKPVMRVIHKKTSSEQGDAKTIRYPLATALSVSLSTSLRMGTSPVADGVGMGTTSAAAVGSNQEAVSARTNALVSAITNDLKATLQFVADKHHLARGAETSLAQTAT